MGREAARRLLAALFAAESWVAGIAFGLVSAALFVDVIGREFFGSGIYGAQRSAVYGMVVSAFLGLALATQRAGHIRIEGLDRLVPSRLRPVVVRAGHLLSAAICLFLATWAAEFAAVSFEQGERAMALDILVWPIKLVLPYAFASAAVRFLVFARFPELEEKPEIA